MTLAKGRHTCIVRGYICRGASTVKQGLLQVLGSLKLLESLAEPQHLRRDLSVVMSSERLLLLHHWCSRRFLGSKHHHFKAYQLSLYLSYE
jgi:hypothetical protein